MKALRIPLFVLLLLLVFSLGNSAAVSRHCRTWTAQIDAIDRNVEAQRWSDAADGLEALYRDWTDCQTWFHVVIEHREIDAAEALLRRCRVLCQEEDDVEFRASLSDLRSQLTLLDEMERVSIKNIM